ncbi:MAG: ASKHA domain-containing protein [Kiritimatiellaeota bacterium]|nr:ASKHA domain-containing protein [Kiritimatiellota bacterium]
MGECLKTRSITFLPDNITIKAASGKSVLEAAVAAGMAINSVCGGDGVCGKCRVLVKSGKVTAQPNMFLDRSEIQRGMALACQTFIDGDVVIEVPLESRVGGVPQLATEDAIRYGSISDWVGEGALFPHNPLFQKAYLDLPEPTMTDSLCDQERVFREIRRNRAIPIMQTGLAIIQRLPDILRQNDWQVTALLGCRGGTVELVDVEPGNTAATNLGVALDLGTTTVVTHLVDLNTSRTLATKAKYNSQISFGDDVISRIMFGATPERRTQLREVIVNDINDLIAALVVDAKVKLNDVYMVACAGNTTMIHLLCALNPANIRKEPYIPAASCPPTIRAAEVGIKINSRGLLAALPAVASYVGGDVVADVLVSGMMHSTELSLLIDLGTNGELVLGHAEWLVCCSASAGPSFEGGGITCGMRATNGAIEHIQLGPDGAIVQCSVVGGGKPLGLCGSGLIDAVGELLKTGCIDRRGRFDPATCGGRLQEGDTGDQEFLLFPGSQTALGRDLVLTEADINNLIHSKGSIYMAAECLLNHVSMTFDDLQHVYIAGGFGNYLKIEQGIRIGLLPDLAPAKFKYIGNGSVQGAKMALLSQEALRYVHEIAGAMTYLELSTNHQYMNEYSSCLFLPHTNIEKFPSLAGEFRKRSVRKAGP